jgi:hypothetical protein
VAQLLGGEPAVVVGEAAQAEEAPGLGPAELGDVLVVGVMPFRPNRPREMPMIP